MGGSDQRNRTVDGAGEVKLFISARDVRFSANNGLKSDISPCPFGANNGSRAHSITSSQTVELAAMVIRAARLAAVLLRIARDRWPAKGPPGL